MLLKGASITLQWVPGHTDIDGNEKADELAKKASKEPPSSGCKTSWAMFGLRVKAIRAREWIKAVQVADRKKGANTREFKPSSKLKVGQGVKRVIASTFYQLKLGHGY